MFGDRADSGWFAVSQRVGVVGGGSGGDYFRRSSRLRMGEKRDVR